MQVPGTTVVLVRTGPLFEVLRLATESAVTRHGEMIIGFNMDRVAWQLSGGPYTDGDGEPYECAA